MKQLLARKSSLSNSRELPVIAFSNVDEKVLQAEERRSVASEVLLNLYRDAPARVIEALCERVLEKKEEWGDCFTLIGITGEGKQPNFQIRNLAESEQVSYHGARGKEILSGYSLRNLSEPFASKEIINFASLIQFRE